MVELQNDVLVARERATALANGLSSLTSSGTVAKDSETKLGGNTKAQEVIDKSHELSVQVGQVLISMSQHIQSVSSSFQAMDADWFGGKSANDWAKDGLTTLLGGS